MKETKKIILRYSITAALAGLATLMILSWQGFWKTFELATKYKILADAFGVVAMVAMAPLITIQLLGFKAVLTRQIHSRIAMHRILNADDEQIIEFM